MTTTHKPKNGWRDIVRMSRSMPPGRTNEPQKEDWAYLLKQIKEREQVTKNIK